MSQKHQAVFRITLDAFEHLFAALDGRALVRVSGLPPGWTLNGVHVDPDRQLVAFRVEAESLPVTEDGHALPLLPLTIERVEIASGAWIALD